MQIRRGLIRQYCSVQTPSGTREANKKALRNTQKRMIPCGTELSTVMNEIRTTNNHLLISHYLYAFIDFWCLVERHHLIWLACIFFYGYLYLLNPLIIVGESSKLLDDRGRLRAACLKRTSLIYPYQLLAICSMRQQLVSADGYTLTPIDGLSFQHITEYAFQHPPTFVEARSTAGKATCDSSEHDGNGYRIVS